MTIFYNISIPTFLVDCLFFAKPTKFARGGKNSLKPAKNPQLPKIPNPAKNPQGHQKSLTPPKISGRQKSPCLTPKWSTGDLCQKPHDYQSERSEDWEILTAFFL